MSAGSTYCPGAMERGSGEMGSLRVCFFGNSSVWTGGEVSLSFFFTRTGASSSACGLRLPRLPPADLPKAIRTSLLQNAEIPSIMALQREWRGKQKRDQKQSN